MITENLSLSELKLEISQSAQRGYPIIIAGAVYWALMGFLGLVLEREAVALAYILAMMVVFPLGIGLGKLLKVELISRTNPLGTLGALLAGVQMCYLPVYILVYQSIPEWVPGVIGILGGSHFLPYGWIYRSRAYYFQTGAMVIASLLFVRTAYTLLPVAMVAIYLATTFLLIRENRSLPKLADDTPLGSRP